MNILSYMYTYLSTYGLNTLGIPQMKSTQWLLLSTRVWFEHFFGAKLNTFYIPKKQIQAMVEKPLSIQVKKDER